MAGSAGESSDRRLATSLTQLPTAEAEETSSASDRTWRTCFRLIGDRSRRRAHRLPPPVQRFLQLSPGIHDVRLRSAWIREHQTVRNRRQTEIVPVMQHHY